MLWREVRLRPDSLVMIEHISASEQGGLALQGIEQEASPIAANKTPGLRERPGVRFA
jgi:hypothetical protein